MRHVLLAVTTLAVLSACAPPRPATSASTIVRHTTEAKFETVRDEVQAAILAKGLVIDNTAYIAKMLDRTGKDVGAAKALFADGQGQAFSFCSAAVSRKTIEADPHNIAFCPYAILVYSTAAEPKKVHIAYRRPVLAEGSEAARASLKEVEDLLEGIVRDALKAK